MVLLKAIAHNVLVVLVGCIWALIGTLLDLILHIHPFTNPLVVLVGIILLSAGFLLRVWATYYFYKANINVIVLHPQQKLITKGPFAYSRNPLYLGGNVFIFLGASLVLGTIMGIVMTLLHLPLVNLMILREEKQLAKKFGVDWTTYTKKTRRWI